MATYYTQAQLALLNQTTKAKTGQDYVQLTGVGKGTLYRGNLDGTLQWITDNFDVNAQNAVISIMSSSETTTPDTVLSEEGAPGSIQIDVDQFPLSKVDDTNVTLTLGGSPLKALLASVSLTLGWTGVLSYLRGGTGLSALGTAFQQLRVNATETALEYFTPSSGSGTVTNVDTAGLISGGPITTTGTITTSMNTNKLVGRSTAGTGIMEEITVGSGLTLSAGTLNNTATPTPVGYYGAWQTDATQTAAADNIGYETKFTIADIPPNGISIVNNGSGDPTRITFANTGIYNIQFSSQFQNADNTEHDVTIWLRLNGSDVAGSSGFVQVPRRRASGAGNEGHCIVSWNYVLSIVAGEYYELVWSTTNHTNITMQYYAAGSPPPSTASVILTVTQQSGIMAGTGITAINSLTGAAQTIVAGTSGTDFAVSSVGTTHTLNLPSASATARGVVTINGQTFAGAKTFSTAPVLSSLTASEILALDASNNIQSLPVATYPSLTELSYVKGVTSAIQTQLANAGEWIKLTSAILSPADSTAYLMPNFATLAPAATTGARVWKFTKSGTVLNVNVAVNQSANGSSEVVTVYLRNNTTATDYLCGTFTLDGGVNANTFANYSVSIPINTTDLWAIKILTPAWVTNPTNCYFSVTIFNKS